MGSFLDKPKTDKETHTLDGLDLRVGVSAMQGWRVDMEDAHVVQLGIPGEPTYSFFAVFDGHGGSFVSRTSAEQLLNRIMDTPEWKSGDRTPSRMAEGIRKGFLDMDEVLKRTPEVMRGDDHSGSTAITALVTPTHIFVGNCGDSRAMLVRSNQAVEMSVDHKPYLPTETARIEAAGGTVAMRRVNGDLAVSRALGDFVYKRAKDLPAERQQVSPEPEVKVVERVPAADQFLVLACDGIWDVMNNQEVAAYLLDTIGAGVDDLGRLAEALIDEGLHKQSRDNMSAIIVAFPGAPRPSAEAVESFNQRLAAHTAAEARRAGDGRMDDSDESDK